jgi:hypothetical protein
LENHRNTELEELISEVLELIRMENRLSKVQGTQYKLGLMLEVEPQSELFLPQSPFTPHHGGSLGSVSVTFWVCQRELRHFLFHQGPKPTPIIKEA